ncbi:ABC transporter substrate-binding protein [Phormidium yuhuli AB48]|uniref:ABC transporter substrate-binding protein n=1 Tax=Phormidium yuhuli AB48 TaxID=2940671 RepID=A0ABY5AMP0_9CYAN|nr:ABC transporter substrate-binding protein [Phormidium yuhuli]USR90454.1 ABC transporter substrate-binding protein [Phormidium yuhuli AB48]
MFVLTPISPHLRPLRRLLSLGLLALVLLLGLSSCQIEQFRVREADGNQIILGQLSDPKTFNAALSQESPNVFSYIYEGLVTSDGETAEVIPALAESWETSEDNLRLVFTLREGLRWSDGEPLTADDVIFTFNDIYFNRRIPSSTRDVLRVGESGEFPTIQKLDDRRIEVLLPEPFSPILRTLGSPILPEHILRSAVEDVNEDGDPRFNTTWGTNTPPEEIISNGPYRLSQYTPGQRVRFERNPYYWDKEEDGTPRPHINSIVWQVVENQDTQLLQFRSGGLSSIGVTPPHFSLLKQEEERGNFSIYEDGPQMGTTFISFNLNRGRNANGRPLVDPIKSKWFNTLAFRQAVAHAIDRQTMINSIFRGLGEPQNSPISIQSPYYLSPEEGLPTYEHDLDKARQLLLEAGFQYDDRGRLLDEDGNRVQFELITNAGNQTREAMGAQIRQDLSRIGIQVNFTPMDFNNLVNQLSNTLGWEAHLLGFTGGVEPHGSLTIFSVDGRLHSFNQNRDDPPLEGRVIEDWERDIEALFIRGSQVFGEEERREIYGQAQILVQENLPFIYLVNPLSMGAVRNTIEGTRFSAIGGMFWNLPELRIEE